MSKNRRCGSTHLINYLMQLTLPHVFCSFSTRDSVSTLNRCTPSFRTTPVCPLRRLRSAIRLVRFSTTRPPDGLFYVFPPPPFPLCAMFEGTHGVRSAWDNPTLNYSLSIINSQSGFFFITPYCLGYCFGVGAVFSKTKSARFSPLARVRLFVSVCFAHSTF